MSTKLERAIATIKAGDKAAGRKLLIKILESDENNELAWLWLTQTGIPLPEQIECLERVLEINPNNQDAQRGLPKLKARLAKQNQPRTIQPSQSKLTPRSPKQVTNMHPSGTMGRMTDRQVISQYIAQKSTKGWEVISREDHSVQLKRPKQWSKVGLILGAATAIVGLGFLILFLTLIDYLLQKEKVIFVTADDIRLGSVPKEESNTVQLVLIGMALFAFMICCFALASTNASAATLF